VPGPPRPGARCSGAGMKYVFVTGGVVSGLGKGILASSVGALLRARGFKVTALKADPYINVDAGTMRPYEHGEVFVTADGAETDLDIGNYERFLDVDLQRKNNITTGQVYLAVIQNERRGEYLSQTVQVIPHITDEIKERIRACGRDQGAEIVVVEIGGTVGDIESLPFLEAIRQFRFEEGRQNTLYLHVTLVPQLGAAEELKTKPTQHSVAALRGLGIQPDAIIARSTRQITDEARGKIGLFCNLEEEAVFNSHTVPHVDELPLILEAQGLGRFVVDGLHLPHSLPNLQVWEETVRVLRRPRRTVEIAVAGKYVALPDAYLSLTEALKHGGVANDARVEIRWVNAENLPGQPIEPRLKGAAGILVPGGFGIRGIEGKVKAAEYARVHGLPFLGICLGLQVATIEFARNVAGLEGANSTEFDPDTRYPVIDMMPEQLEVEGVGGTMRLGDWPMHIRKGTLLHRIYGGTELVMERHRHRYEVNPAFVEELEAAGLKVCGVTPGMQGRGAGLVEGLELPGHPFFVGLQSHPELRSRPMRPAPVFAAFIAAALGQRSD